MLAAEDKRFYLHHGIDIFATERAGYDFGSNRRVISAASTITQQLAKISSLPTSRNLKAKFYEAMAARLLEMSWEKGRILEAYFNRPDHGNLPISQTKASRFYFQKPLSDLSLGECALLAGLPQAPSRLNPIRNPKNALARRVVVLDRPAATGGILRNGYRAGPCRAAKNSAIARTESGPLAEPYPRRESPSPSHARSRPSEGYRNDCSRGNSEVEILKPPLRRCWRHR